MNYLSKKLYVYATIPLAFIIALILVINGRYNEALTVLSIGSGALIIRIHYSCKAMEKDIVESINNIASLLFVTYGLFLGTTDALVGDMWDVKSFIWVLILSLLTLFVSATSLKPLDTAVGLVSMHGGWWSIAWMFTTVMLGKPLFINGNLWVMPNIIIPAWLYILIVFGTIALHVYWYHIRK